jgi:hypothetical protein
MSARIRIPARLGLYERKIIRGSALLVRGILAWKTERQEK